MNYKQFVKSKECDYNSVVSKLGNKLRAFHHVVGIIGEMQEFLKGYNEDDEKNMREELGDIMFYLYGLHDSAFGNEPTFKVEPLREFYKLNIIFEDVAFDILDVMKKATFHVDDSAQFGLTEKQKDSLLTFSDYVQCFIIQWLKETYQNVYSELEEIKIENVNKLNKRYKERANQTESENRNIENELSHYA